MLSEPPLAGQENQGHQRAWSLMTIILAVPNLSALLHLIGTIFVVLSNSITWTSLVSRMAAGIRGVQSRIMTLLIVAKGHTRDGPNRAT